MCTRGWVVPATPKRLSRKVLGSNPPGAWAFRLVRSWDHVGARGPLDVASFHAALGAPPGGSEIASCALDAAAGPFSRRRLAWVPLSLLPR